MCVHGHRYRGYLRTRVCVCAQGRFYERVHVCAHDVRAHDVRVLGHTYCGHVHTRMCVHRGVSMSAFVCVHIMYVPTGARLRAQGGVSGTHVCRGHTMRAEVRGVPSQRCGAGHGARCPRRCPQPRSPRRQGAGAVLHRTTPPALLGGLSAAGGITRTPTLLFGCPGVGAKSAAAPKPPEWF